MSKPKTTYASVAKPKTAFADVAKNKTAFARAGATAAWLLNSTVVTLNSTLYRLNGYTTATAPDQTGDVKPTTAYQEF